MQKYDRNSLSKFLTTRSGLEFTPSMVDDWNDIVASIPQKQENGVYLVNNYIMSFMAVVPSNDPEAVLYLAIDNPKHTAMLSSYTTTPIARRILLDIIDALKIKKQEGELSKDLEWNDKVTYEVPNVIGMTKEEAKKNLFNFQIVVEGEGEKVLDQSPKAGEKLEDQSKIRILLK